MCRFEWCLVCFLWFNCGKASGIWGENFYFCSQYINKPHVGETAKNTRYCGFKYPQGTRYGDQTKTLQNMYFHKFLKNSC